MKKLLRLLPVLIVLIISLSAFTAFAESTSYEIDELSMSISIPNDMLAITRDSEKTDSYFSKFNLKYKETMNRFKDGNIYLQAMKEDSSLTLTVTMTEDKNSKKVSNYAYLSASELKSIMNKYLNDNAYKSGSVIECNNLKYIFLTMSTKSGKKIVQAQQYLTVINGMNITLTLDAPAGEKLTSDDTEMFTEIIRNTVITENNFFVRYQNVLIYGGVTLLGIIIVAVVFIILLKKLRNPERKHNNIVHDLAHKHRISETTKIPRKKSIFNVTKPTMSFMKNYKPLEEIDKRGNEVPEDEEEAAPIIDKAELEEKPPVVSESSTEFKDKPLTAKKPKREVPLAEKIVANNVKRASEPVEEEVPIAQPMEFKEKEPVEKKRPEIEDVEVVSEVEEENLDPVDDYFEEVPAKKDMYSYTDVDTAVDEYTAAKEEARMIREERSESLEAVGNVFKAIGRGILRVLSGIWMVICYLAIHIKYFCINVFRAIKKSRARKKRQKAEAARKQKLSEERRRQREAEMARRRQNANRGENDLVKVRSSEERRPVRRTVYPSNRRPQQRPSAQQRTNPRNRPNSQHRPRG